MLALTLGALLLALPAGASAAEPETGTITGTVSAAGGPLVGEVEVCAKAIVDESTFKCTLVAADGSYAITKLPPGEYKVGFWPTGNYVTQFWQGGLTWGEAAAVPVKAETPTPDIEAVLQAGATISGTVTAAATATPVEKVEACANLVEPEHKLELERCAMTDGLGDYRIDGLVVGRWSVYFYAQRAEADVVSGPYAGGSFEVGPRQNQTGVSEALIPGGQIAGTVRLTGSGAPVGGVQVCVTTTMSPTPLGCLRTPSSGAYRFMRVWPGTYKVVFSPEPSAGEAPSPYPTQWWGGQSSFAAAAPIEITPPAIVNNIDASLVPPPSPAPPPPIATPVVKKPRLHCKRNFVKRKVHGKQRCVKRHVTKPKPHHRMHRAQRQAAPSPTARP
ncbi:MAG TPA: carboxypeptidase-like regulatory domain-containing protein [Solirubrobacterales bacterium]